MPGNSFGQLFRITTWGESHGPAVGVVVDGCPPGLTLSEAQVQADLDRRRPGGSPGSTARRESDTVAILSGVFEGRTTGTPIAMQVRNVDADPSAYDHLRDIYRPGQADFTYQQKYGIRDHRGGGRASARETVGRVAGGAVARRVLREEGMEVRGCTRALGGILAKDMDPWTAEENRMLCPDAGAAEEMVRRMEELRASGDSAGGIVEIRARGCPAGLGEPVFDKLDADLAKALMSIGAVKGVEVGAGFEVARLTGSQCNDIQGPAGFRTNRSGGILGGISTGQEIIVRAAVKPIASIGREQEMYTRKGEIVVLGVGGRHDVCAIPRIIPVCEAMVCLVLADHLLRHRGQCGKTRGEK